MPNVDYKITLNLNTESDIDLIQFMDQYSSNNEKLETILKSIIRFYITKTNESSRIENRLDSIEDAVYFLKNNIQTLRTALSKDDIINTNLIPELSKEDEEELHNTISSIFEE